MTAKKGKWRENIGAERKNITFRWEGRKKNMLWTVPS
jgi:hypothetical protein